MIAVGASIWRVQRGIAPFAVSDNPLAAGAAHILALAADQAWSDANAETQVIQTPVLLNAAIGQTVIANIDDGRTLSGKISAIEHIIDPPLAVTRLEIEVAQ